MVLATLSLVGLIIFIVFAVIFGILGIVFKLFNVLIGKPILFIIKTFGGVIIVAAIILFALGFII